MMVLIYIILFIFVNNILGDYELRHVQLLYRHGDRAPVFIYPKDINNISKWPNGIGQLTDEGIRQQYNFGLWLRQRYSKLLGPTIRYSDIYVRSTDYDRSLMSAETNLAGLMFNDSRKIIQGLSWRPVAIHTVKIKKDSLLELKACPRYIAKRKEQYDLEYFKKKFTPYQSMLLYVSESTGITNLTLMTMWKVYDILFCEFTHSMTVNDWVTKDMWQKLSTFNIITWELMFYKDLAKLAGGLLLHTIIENLKEISLNGTWLKEGSKMIMYSGHDTDLAPLALLLGFYDNIQPPYSSSIIFELYHDANLTESWAVKVLYKNDTESLNSVDIRPQLINGCSSFLCPLSTFIKVTEAKSMSKEEFIKECAIKTDILNYTKWAFISACVAVFLIIIVMFCIRYRNGENIKYSRLNKSQNIN